MKTLVVIEKAKDGSFGVYTPDLKTTLWGQGNTVAEAKEMMLSGYNDLVQLDKEDVLKLTDELIDLEFEYRYDLSSFFNYYTFINVSKFAQVAGINASLMRQYKKGDTYISEEQSAKIEKALHKLGNELSAIKLI